MSRILLIHLQTDALIAFVDAFRGAGHVVTTASSGSDSLTLLATDEFDAAIADLELGDRSCLEILSTIRGWRRPIPFIVLGVAAKTTAVLSAMRLGATDVATTSTPPPELLRIIERALTLSPVATPRRPYPPPPQRVEAHAAARLAHALVRLVECPKDPTTIASWARWIGASAGALRNWSAAAGVQARHSLAFGRILRAVLRSAGERPEDLLDIGDLRTLRRMLKLSGFLERDGFPAAVGEFLESQTLIRDPEILDHVRQALT